MAITTLEKCHYNGVVFTSVVKSGKGILCQLINYTMDISELHRIFNQFVSSINNKAKKAHNKRFSNISEERMIKVCLAIMVVELTEMDAKKAASHTLLVNSTMIMVSCAASCLAYIVLNNGNVGSSKKMTITTAVMSSFGILLFCKTGYIRNLGKRSLVSSLVLPVTKLCK